MNELWAQHGGKITTGGLTAIGAAALWFWNAIGRDMWEDYRTRLRERSRAQDAAAGSQGQLIGNLVKASTDGQNRLIDVLLKDISAQRAEAQEARGILERIAKSLEGIEKTLIDQAGEHRWQHDRILEIKGAVMRNGKGATQ